MIPVALSILVDRLVDLDFSDPQFQPLYRSFLLPSQANLQYHQPITIIPEWRGGEGGADNSVLFCSGNPGVGKTFLRQVAGFCGKGGSG